MSTEVIQIEKFIWACVSQQMALKALFYVFIICTN